MSDVVRAEIQIDAPPERVWDLMMDPARFGDWVTIHRKIVDTDAGPPRKGMRMEQSLCLRGATFKVKWTLAECEHPRRATWEGKGPIRSHARTAYELQPSGGGTRFLYENEFRAPGGPLGAAASRVLVGGLPEREAKASLRKLKLLLER